MYMEYNKLKEYIEDVFDFVLFVFYYIEENDFVF